MATDNRDGWLTLECDAAHYVDRGRTTVLCDRLPHPVTLVVKLSEASQLSGVVGEMDGLREALADMMAVHHGYGPKRCTKSEAFSNARAALNNTGGQSDE